MSSAFVERHFPHPPERVFAVFFAQFEESTAEVQTSGFARVQYLTAPPARSGSRFGIQTRGPFGMRKAGEMSMVEVDPGRWYRTDARTEGWRFEGLVEFFPDAEGTCVRLTVDATPCSFWAALFAPLMPAFQVIILKAVLRKMATLDFTAPASAELAAQVPGDGPQAAPTA